MKISALNITTYMVGKPYQTKISPNINMYAVNGKKMICSQYLVDNQRMCIIKPDNIKVLKMELDNQYKN